MEAAAAQDGVSVESHVQTERLGTGHAVLAATTAIARGYDDVVVVFGDTPLVEPDTLSRARAGLTEGYDVVVIGFEAADPTGYGRLLTKDGELLAIREHKDASEEERKVTLCNGGMMAINGRRALECCWARSAIPMPRANIT